MCDTNNHNCINPKYTRNRDSLLVCSECGIIIEEESIYDVSYDIRERTEIIPNNLRERTIGNQYERNSNEKYKRLDYLNKMRYMNYDKVQISTGIVELNRIISILYVSNINKKKMHSLFNELYYKINKSTKLKNPFLLAAVVFYLYSINSEIPYTLDEISNIVSFDKNIIFRHSQTIQKIHFFKAINKNRSIITKIHNICNRNKLNKSIQLSAIKMIEKCNKNTTINIIATSLVYISLRNSGIKFSVSKFVISSGVNISIGSVISYVKDFFGFDKKIRFYKLENKIWSCK